MGAREEKLKDIQEAVEMYKQANELVAKANELITRNVEGLELVGHMPEPCGDYDNRAYRGKMNVHIYKGIYKLAGVLCKIPKPEVDLFGFEYPNRKALVVDGIKFFQLGEASQNEICYR